MNSSEQNIPISVIMGVYNQRARAELELAISSVLDQTFQDFEFLIFDDGSEEGEAQHLAKLAEQDARIKVIRSEKNHGLAWALNECIRRARGTYIARMDADDISKPERFLIQKQFLDNHREYSWVGCNAELIDKHGVWGHQKMREIPKERDFLRYSPYIHPAVMYRKSVLDVIGGYRVSNETLRCEDYDIFMRLHMAGYQGYNIQQELFSYREHQSAYHKRSMKSRLIESRLRYQSFKKMKLLIPLGFFYVMRPIVGGIVPVALHIRIRRSLAR